MGLKFKEMPKEEIDLRVKALKKCQELLSSLGFNMYLNSGTLLGAIRDKKFIGNDDDIDVCYLSNETKASEVQKETQELHKKLQEMNLLADFWLGDKGCSWRQGNSEIPLEVYGHFHVNIDGILIDIWTTWIDSYGDLQISFCGNFGHAGHFLPLEHIKFYGEDFTIPRDYDRMLTLLYQDWKKPSNVKPMEYWTEIPYLTKEVKCE